ncbi:hypothetical protein SCG7109_AB_00710 [Chlamydiales bacterium SCGC AG-110-M15]|nr:hypothetical protein SCG7109_AB_00710 [Chlamydiales bacterium SCGC AG-110-M15]
MLPIHACTKEGPYTGECDLFEASIFLDQHIYFASLLAQPYWV